MRTRPAGMRSSGSPGSWPPSAAEFRCVPLTLHPHPKTSNLFPEFGGMFMVANRTVLTSHAPARVRIGTPSARAEASPATSRPPVIVLAAPKYPLKDPLARAAGLPGARPIHRDEASPQPPFSSRPRRSVRSGRPRSVLEAAFRLGDCESLHRLQERCEDVSTRPAGWSALFDANLPSGRAGQHVPDSAGKEPLPGA